MKQTKKWRGVRGEKGANMGQKVLNHDGFYSDGD
jgi:hypothetical protein